MSSLLCFVTRGQAIRCSEPMHAKASGNKHEDPLKYASFGKRRGGGGYITTHHTPQNTPIPLWGPQMAAEGGKIQLKKLTIYAHPHTVPVGYAHTPNRSKHVAIQNKMGPAVQLQGNSL